MYLGLLPQRDVGLFVCAKEPHRIGEEGGEVEMRGRGWN